MPDFLHTITQRGTPVLLASALSDAAGAALAAAGFAGSSGDVARADHMHPYPTAAQVGAADAGHTHSNATTSVSGFLSNSDKGKLDKYPFVADLVVGRALMVTGAAAINFRAIEFADITQRPTTLAGYGISDAASLSHTHAGVYQPADGDLSAIAALAGTSGILTKTAANTWTLDTTDYPTANGVGASGTWAISISGTAANASTLGGLALAGGSAAPGANQVIRTQGSGHTFFGYIYSGTGNNENPTISQIIVTNGSDNYYRKASLAHLNNSIAPHWVNIQSRPTTVVGYGITDAVSTSGGVNIAGNIGIQRAVWTGARLGIQGGTTGTSAYSIVCYDSSGANTFWARDDGCAKVFDTLYVNSTTYASDARLKQDIAPLQGALDLLLAIPARSWRWRADVLGRLHYGPIAQEAEAVAPELVEEAQPGPGEVLPHGQRGQLYLKASSMVGLLHGAVQELAVRVATLEQQRSSL